MSNNIVSLLQRALTLCEMKSSSRLPQSFSLNVKKVPLVHICFSYSTAGHFDKFCRAVNLKINVFQVSFLLTLLASSEL